MCPAWSSVKVPEFDKHMKKAGGHIGQNIVEITIKMKTRVKKTLNDENHLDIHPKVFWIAWMEIKPAYYDFAVQYFNPYTTLTTPSPYIQSTYVG